jgi:hypothetical protein
MFLTENEIGNINIRVGHQNFLENVIFTKLKKIGADQFLRGRWG